MASEPEVGNSSTMMQEEEVVVPERVPNGEAKKLIVGEEDEGGGDKEVDGGGGGGGEDGRGPDRFEPSSNGVSSPIGSEIKAAVEQTYLQDTTNGDALEENMPILGPSHCYDCKAKEIDIQIDRYSQRSGHSRSKCKLPRRCCCSPSFNPFCRQLGNVIVACLAGLSVGTIHAFPAISLPRWEEMGFILTTAQTTWFASIPMVVSVMVCWASGIVVESLGNRKCLMIGMPFLALSWIVIAMAESFWALMLGRIIQGLIASVNMVVITVYPAEVSIVKWRGIMTGISEAMVMLGALLTYLAGLVLEPSHVAIFLTLGLIPMMVCYYFLRDSPLWLVRQDKDEEAAATLKCLRGPTVDITEELEQIKESVATERIQKPSATEQLLLLRKVIYLKPMTLSVLVLLFKELTGQYAAMAYTVKIFKMAGSSLDPYWCAVVMGAARFLPCFTSWILIERLPRRLLICSCMAISSFALAALGTFLWFWSRKDGVPPHLGWVPLACLLVFTLAFGSGVGPTCWTLVAELLPSQVRNVGAGIINTSFSLFLFLVGLTFPFMIEAIGIGLVFIVYSLCSLLGVIFIICCLPETKGRSFTEIQIALKASVYMVIITVYPAEVTIVKWRGIMMGISESMVMLGAFLTYIAGLVLEVSQIAIIMTLSLIPMMVCYYFLRETPLWLARQDKDEEAAATLRCLRGPTTDITEELEHIKESVATERIQKPSATEQLLLLRKGIYLKPMTLAILILLFKELTGQYATMAYTIKIFKMAGSSLDPYWCAVVMGAARFLPCFTSWILIERLPRRLLICSCMAISSFSLAALGTFLWFWSRKDGVPPHLGWVPLACLLVFTFAFGSGVGPTCWTLVAELLPSQVRNVGAGIINTSFSLFLFLVGLTFPYMINGMGIGLVYIVYSVCSLCGVIFVIICVPETKGRSFTEIQIALKGNKYESSNSA